LTGVAYVLIIVLVELLAYSTELKLTIAVYSLTLLVSGLSGSFTAVYQASERIFHSAMGTILEKSVTSIVAVLLLTAGFGITAIAAVFVGGAVVSVLWKGFFLRRTVQITAALDIRTMRKLVMGALPFFF